MATLSLAPETGGRSDGRAGRTGRPSIAWPPAARRRPSRTARAHARPRPRQPLPPHRRRRGLEVALPALRHIERRAGCTSATPSPPSFEYTDYLQLGHRVPPFDPRALHRPRGGSAPKLIWHDFPGIDIRVAELDRRRRGCRTPVLRAPPEPAPPRDRRRRAPVPREARPSSRTLIGIDTFYSDSIPFHMTTREFLEIVRDHLWRRAASS